MPANGSNTPPVTPDGRYIVVRGVLWRRSDPQLSKQDKQVLLSELGQARQAVKQAKQGDDAGALRAARNRVHGAKVRLGERGPVWWNDGSPDLTGKQVERTEYADWWRGQGQ